MKKIDLDELLRNVRSATPEELTAQAESLGANYKPGPIQATPFMPERIGDHINCPKHGLKFGFCEECVESPEELPPLAGQLYSALDRLRKNAQHIFDAKSVRDWCETLAEADAALEAYRTDSDRILSCTLPVPERTAGIEASGGTMSEEQVLPERPKIRSDKHYNLVFDAEPADAYMDSLEAYSAALHETIVALRASLAQSEAERERLQVELAQKEESRDFWRSSWYALDEEKRDTEAELARERELHQGLRQVVKEYRATVHRPKKPSDPIGPPCQLCIKADALLEDKSKPVATEDHGA